MDRLISKEEQEIKTPKNPKPHIYRRSKSTKDRYGSKAYRSQVNEKTRRHMARESRRRNRAS